MKKLVECDFQPTAPLEVVESVHNGTVWSTGNETRRAEPIANLVCKP